MAKFVEVPISGGGEAFVNIDRINYIRPTASGSCVIHFDEGKELNVAMNASEIAHHGMSYR
jgi:hypothetical protein